MALLLFKPLRRLLLRLVRLVALALVALAAAAGVAVAVNRSGRRGGVSGESPRSEAPTDEPLPGASPGVSGTGLAASTSAADGPPLAPAPLETPGPSVTPPREPESDTERAEEVDRTTVAADEGTPDDDILIAREESAAAAEAARIGGVVAQDADDPAMEPVYEAGGGDQDGWEAAEQDLIENATHGDGFGQPERDAISPELESDRSGAVYGEADQAQDEDRG